MWGEEEWKRTVLASSSKRADILYHLKLKYIELVFNKVACVMSIFVFVKKLICFKLGFKKKLIINGSINNHIILLLYEENIHI